MNRTTHKPRWIPTPRAMGRLACLAAWTFAFAGACGPEQGGWDLEAFWQRLTNKRSANEQASQAGAQTDQAALQARVQSAAIRDTIGAAAWLEGGRLMRVRGYGIVTGLGERGSRECPRRIREALITEMRKRYGLGLRTRGLGHLDPAELIDSLDTAVVAVHGEIPAASLKGTHFDVLVEALDRTQTVSLEGGHLLECDLRLYRLAGTGAVLEGKVLARAFGPVFVESFDEQAGSAAGANPRRGYVIGGGVSLEDRRVRLGLAQPGYALATRIQDRINERFGFSPKVADAVSPGQVNLIIPERFRGRESRFLQVLMHLYLPRQPGFVEQRARELADEILSPLAPYEDISLAWEGIGRPALEVIQPLYSHEDEAVRFYAARAGLRIGDELAVPVLRDHARDAGSPYRLLAVRELGDARPIPAATRALRALVDEADPDVRVAAYEGLRKHPDGGIASTPVGSGSFVLEVVPTRGRYLIFAKRSISRRIAVFGQHLRCEPPLFYCARDGAITIHARAKDEHLTLIRKTPFTGRFSEPIEASFDVAELIRMLGDDPVTDDSGKVRGLRLDYGHVIDAIRTLCRDGAIPAEFLLEQPGVTGILPTALSPASQPSE